MLEVVQALTSRREVLSGHAPGDLMDPIVGPRDEHANPRWRDAVHLGDLAVSKTSAALERHLPQARRELLEHLDGCYQAEPFFVLVVRVGGLAGERSRLP